MSFGEDLQQLSSHRALLQLQDAEIQLLELTKKCIHQRIKSDREYANALTVIINHAQKFDCSISNPLFQVWNTIVHETHSWIDLLRDHAEKLSSRALDKLLHIISEKKTVRKFYQEERIRLDNELSKLKDEVTRLRQEYEKTVSKQIQDRMKLEENVAKGAPPKKIEDARSKLIKTSTKLHKIHNDYVIAVHEVSLYQKHYLNTTLPGMLNYQQTIQQSLVTQCKTVLTDYADLTDLSTPSHASIYKTIHEQVETISATKEYEKFLQENKTGKLAATTFEFDNTLLQDYIGTLKPNILALDDLTIETLNQSCNKVKDQLQECQQRITNKESSFHIQQDQLVKMQSDEQNLTDMQRNSITVHQRAVLDLERELQELRCKEVILNDIHEKYSGHLKKLGDSNPPPGVDLLDNAASAPNYEHTDDADEKSESPEIIGMADAGSMQADGAKGIANNIQSQFKFVMNKLKKSSGGGPMPPPPPAKDFLLESSRYNDGEMKQDQVSVKNYEEESNSSVKRTLPVITKMGHGSVMSDSYQQITFDEEKITIQQMIPNPLRKLDDEDWYHGVLPREEVQRLLVNDGDYLVRASKNRKTGETQYVLSVHWQDYKHFIIQGQEGSWRFEAEQFPTIQELIINQHNSHGPVTRKSGTILIKPIVHETWELRNDDVSLGQKIGNGNFGDVFKGTYKPLHQEVAIKTCRETLTEDAKKKFLQEGRILKQYEHPHIVRFIGIAAQRHPVMIVMEYVSGGSLLNFLKKQGSHQTKKQLIKMCKDASDGMEYLESRNCIHRDLAARNCLVGKGSMIKISDFGMSREEEEYTVSGGLKQIPIKWTAPEALNYGTYTSACDVWSFGVLMWEVFSHGQSPYPGLTNTQARERVDDGYRMPCPDSTPPAAYELMLRCWHQEPKERPRFEDIHKDLQKIHKSLPFR